MQDGRPMVGKKYAYRVLWELRYGALPVGYVLHHTCEHPWCVHLAHLEPMTQAQHMIEHGWGGDWGQAFKTHCPAEHEYDAENTYWYWDAKDESWERHCRECVRAAKRRYRARQRACATKF